MQNITEILKENGIELTEEQITAVSKAVSENYKTVAEFDKKVGKAETERDNFKAQLDTANETLKSFDGVDADGMKKQIEKYQEDMKKMEEDHKKAIYDRDFSDALKASMESYKFSSDYAKKSVMAEISEAGLKLVDGKIIGLNDMIESIKGKDASAFVDEQQQSLEENKAKFTGQLNNGGQSAQGDPNKMSFQEYKNWRRTQ